MGLSGKKETDYLIYMYSKLYTQCTEYSTIHFVLLFTKIQRKAIKIIVKQYNASQEDFGRDICCKLIVYINNKAYKIKSMIGF